VDEETGLTVDPVRPMTVRHFERDDGQTVTMIVFHCTTGGRDVSVRETEHSRAAWVPLEEVDDRLDTFFHHELAAYRDLDQAGSP